MIAETFGTWANELPKKVDDKVGIERRPWIATALLYVMQYININR